MKAKKMKRAITKEEKDINSAALLLSAFLGFFYYFAFNDNLTGIYITIGILFIILQASYKVEKAEKKAKRRIERIEASYNEMLRNR